MPEDFDLEKIAKFTFWVFVAGLVINSIVKRVPALQSISEGL